MRKLFLLLGILILGVTGVAINDADAQQKCGINQDLHSKFNSYVGGSFNVWMQYSNQSGASSKLTVEANNQCLSATLPADNTDWHWQKLDGQIELEKGIQDFYTDIDDGEVFLDRMIVTQDYACNPVGNGSNCMTDPVSVKITGLINGEYRSNSIIQAEVSGLISGGRVSFYLDDASSPYSVVTTPPYCMSGSKHGVACNELAPGEITPGEHKVRVVATDTSESSDRTAEATITFNAIDEFNNNPEENPAIQDPTKDEVIPDRNEPVTPEANPEPGSDQSPAPTDKPEDTAQPGVTKPTTPAAPVKEKPTVVVGVPAASDSKVSGEIKVVLPEQYLTTESSIYSYRINNEELASTNDPEDEIILNTSEAEDGDATISAVIIQPDGSEETLSTDTEIVNGTLAKIKNYASDNKITTAIIVTTVTMFTVYAGVMFYRARHHIGQVLMPDGSKYQPDPRYKAAAAQAMVKPAFAVSLIMFMGISILYSANNAAPVFAGNYTLNLELENISGDYKDIKTTVSNGAVVGYVRLFRQISTGGGNDDVAVTPPAPSPTPAPDPTPPPTNTVPPSNTQDNNNGLAALSNSRPEYSQYTNVPSNQLNYNALTTPASRPDNGSSPTQGQFRTRCEYSHLAYDDPIVYPAQVGKSHLHMFFGNTKVNANTTTNQLVNSGGSTCQGYELNRTGYWMPALMSGPNKVVVPHEIIVYYKAKYANNVARFDQGLKIIAGTSLGLGTSTWGCGENGFHSNYSSTIPDCRGGTLNAVVVFPQCWNGQLSSADNKSHMRAINEALPNCPSSHPIRLPQIELLVYWRSPPAANTLYLSSDRHGGANYAPGLSLHADWYGGWNDRIMDEWMNNCVRAFRNCSNGMLSGPRELINMAPYQGSRIINIP